MTTQAELKMTAVEERATGEEYRDKAAKARRRHNPTKAAEFTLLANVCFHQAEQAEQLIAVMQELKDAEQESDKSKQLYDGVYVGL